MNVTEAEQTRESFKQNIGFKDFQSFKKIDNLENIYKLGKELGSG